MTRWQELVSLQRLPPIIMLLGRDGIGKEGLLAYLTALHFCTQGSGCGQCTPCHMVLHKTHPEVLWMGVTEADLQKTKDQDNQVFPEDSPLLLADAMRIQEHLELAAGFGGHHRIVVIPHADRLSSNAANRLLKIFEEPPKNCVVLMSTSRLNRMLPTILSRTVKWRLSPPSVHQTLDYLKEVQASSPVREPLDDQLLVQLLEHFGLAPGPVVNLLRLLHLSPDKEEHSESHHAADLMLRAQKFLGAESLDFFNMTQDLVETPSLKKALLLGMGWGRRGSLASMIDTLERVLNHHYRKFLIDSKTPKTQDPFMIQERRGILSKARQLGSKQQISLNAQLLLDDIGLTTLNQ